MITESLVKVVISYKLLVYLNKIEKKIGKHKIWRCLFKIRHPFFRIFRKKNHAKDGY